MGGTEPKGGSSHSIWRLRQTPAGELEMVVVWWGMFTPPAYRKAQIDRGVTIIRNVSSPQLAALADPGVPVPGPGDLLLGAERCRRPQ